MPCNVVRNPFARRSLAFLAGLLAMGNPALAVPAHADQSEKHALLTVSAIVSPACLLSSTSEGQCSHSEAPPGVDHSFETRRADSADIQAESEDVPGKSNEYNSSIWLTFTF